MFCQLCGVGLVIVTSKMLIKMLEQSILQCSNMKLHEINSAKFSDNFLPCNNYLI